MASAVVGSYRGEERVNCIRVHTTRQTWQLKLEATRYELLHHPTRHVCLRRKERWMPYAIA